MTTRSDYPNSTLRTTISFRSIRIRIHLTPQSFQLHLNLWKLLIFKIVLEVVGGGKGDQIEPKEAVLVTFEGRVADNRSIKNGSLFQRFESLLIVVGDSDVVPALDMVRRTADGSIQHVYRLRMDF